MMHSFDSPILQWSLVAVCLAALFWSGFRLLAPDRDIHRCDAPVLIRGYVCRDTAVAQAVMLAVMAAMFAYPSVPAALWQVALVVLGVALAVQLLVSRSGDRFVKACSHLLAITAMLYATTAHTAHATHSTHHMAPPVLTVLFTGAFVLEAALLSGVALAVPARTRLAAAVGPHVVMDLAMVAMLYPILVTG